MAIFSVCELDPKWRLLRKHNRFLIMKRNRNFVKSNLKKWKGSKTSPFKQSTFYRLKRIAIKVRLLVFAGGGVTFCEIAHRDRWPKMKTPIDSDAPNPLVASALQWCCNCQPQLPMEPEH